MAKKKPSSSDEDRRAGAEFVRKLQQSPKFRAALRRAQSSIREFNQEQAAYVAEKNREWLANYGKPYPRDFDDWVYYGALAGISGETLLSDRWSPRSIEPIITGYLRRLRGSGGEGIEHRQPPAPLFPSLDANDIAVLKALSNRVGMLMNLYDLEQATKISRKTVGISLNKLIDLEYANRPDGPRKGAAITDSGNERAKNLAH